jgi:hypothetical protein
LKLSICRKSPFICSHSSKASWVLYSFAWYDSCIPAIFPPVFCARSPLHLGFEQPFSIFQLLYH